MADVREKDEGGTNLYLKDIKADVKDACRVLEVFHGRSISEAARMLLKRGLESYGYYEKRKRS